MAARSRCRRRRGEENGEGCPPPQLTRGPGGVVSSPSGPKTGFGTFWAWKKNPCGDNKFSIFSRWYAYLKGVYSICYTPHLSPSPRIYAHGRHIPETQCYRAIVKPVWRRLDLFAKTQSTNDKTFSAAGTVLKGPFIATQLNWTQLNSGLKGPFIATNLKTWVEMSWVVSL